MNENLRDLIKYRIQQSEETVAEAEVLHSLGHNRGAVNRAYYSMFYAVLALLAARKLGTSKHSGAISMLHREFVRDGLFDANTAKAIDRAFQTRNRSDYQDEAPPEASAPAQRLSPSPVR